MRIAGQAAAQGVGFNLLSFRIRHASVDQMQEVIEFWVGTSLFSLHLAFIPLFFLMAPVGHFGAAPDLIWRVSSSSTNGPE